MGSNPDLKECLNRLAEDYGAGFLDTDPVGLVHRYREKRDIEVSGFIVSAISYGNASQIRKSGDAILVRMGGSPSAFAESTSLRETIEAFQGLQHRWTTSNEIAFLAWTAGEMIRRHGSIGDFVRSLDDPSSKTIEMTIAAMSDWIFSQWSDDFGKGGYKKISYLFPSPRGGSACKRPAMYFRWMTRGPDSVDFGLWRDFIHQSRLVVPVDVHMARMAKRLGFTKRNNADWKAALEITESLKCIEPDDPLKYDFALVRPGILRECFGCSPGEDSSCVLNMVCRGSE